MNDTIDFALISEELQLSMKQSIKGCIIRPSVAVIEIGENITNSFKIKHLEEVCNKVGIYFRHFKFEDDTSELTIVNKIKELNNDDYVNGIVVELPIPEKYNEKRIINTIINSKDICGMTDINIGRFISGRKTISSPISLTISEIFSRINLNLAKKNITLISKNKSLFVPLLTTLLSEKAIVTTCCDEVDDLSKYTKGCDILISAIDAPRLIKKDLVDSTTTIIDLGYSLEKNKIIGDLDNSKFKDENVVYGASNGIWELVATMYLKNILICYNSKKTVNN